MLLLSHGYGNDRSSFLFCFCSLFGVMLFLFLKINSKVKAYVSCSRMSDRVSKPGISKAGNPDFRCFQKPAFFLNSNLHFYKSVNALFIMVFLFML